MMSAAIQGIGVVFARGRGAQAFENALKQGWREPQRCESGVRAHAVPDDLLRDKTILKNMRRADRFSRMATLAAVDAWNDAGAPNISPERVGIIAATGLGPHARTFQFLDGVLDYGDDAASPTDFSHSVHNAAVSYITAALQCHGPAQTLTDFDFAFQQALTVAEGWLAEGRVDVVILGAAEELGEVMLHVASRMTEIPSNGCPAPWDFSRKPRMVPGEGSVFFALTRENGGEKSYAAISAVDPGEQEGNLTIIDAEGMSGDESGADFIPIAGTVANYSPVFGSMMTGVAFQCAAAAMMLKRGKLYADPLAGMAKDGRVLDRTVEDDQRYIRVLKPGHGGERQTISLYRI